jgi:hypothetical protein
MQSHGQPAFLAYDQAFKSATRPSRNLQLCLSTTQLTQYCYGHFVSSCLSSCYGVFPLRSTYYLDPHWQSVTAPTEGLFALTTRVTSTPFLPHNSGVSALSLRHPCLFHTDYRQQHCCRGPTGKTLDLDQHSYHCQTCGLELNLHQTLSLSHLRVAWFCRSPLGRVSTGQVAKAMICERHVPHRTEGFYEDGSLLTALARCSNGLAMEMLCCSE